MSIEPRRREIRLKEVTMREKLSLRAVRLSCLVALTIFMAALGWAQAPQSSQVVAVRAGRLFDPQSGVNLANQVVLIRGDRITDVGAANRVQIPAGAKVIDLSKATVLPGLIDGHVHRTDDHGDQQQQGKQSDKDSIKAGSSTLANQDAHGERNADATLIKAI